MIFEDEFMDKQSEIISLYKEAVNDKVGAINMAKLILNYYQIGEMHIGSCGVSECS